MVGYFDKDKITLKEASNLLNVSQRTMRKWVKDGLEAKKVGIKWMTTREAITAFLDSRGDSNE
tara:strand:+ start:1050 stop:1238 length:189 start_codon:yes stop_codon:yes gene_type:complete